MLYRTPLRGWQRLFGMNEGLETCLDDDALARLCTDGLDPAERDRVDQHLALCPACREIVSALLRGSSEQGLATAPTCDASSEPLPSASMSRIETIGRYLPIAILGRGGMGQVYRAYDPSLEREVALKLVSLAAVTEERAQIARTRLLREGQSLAQLSHPGIVTVYDVGAVPDHVFVAMELIRGQTLRSWLGTKPSRRHILEAFCDAAAALAAAHRVGIIHRDFKPENVMITADRHVKVLDFGLAGVVQEPAEFEAFAVTTPLTVTGALLGTPVYMSPEQLRREPAGPRSDQWSFCVALYEALFERRPFPATTLPELYEVVHRGLPKMPPRPDGVPARVVRALERGLSLDSDHRFATMDELLDELRPRVSRKNRILAAGFAATALVAATALFVHGAGKIAVDCDVGEERMAAVWDGAAWNALKSHLVGRGINENSDTVRRVRQGLDDYAERWVAMHGEACRATHVAGTQSAQLLDLRMECLDRRLREFSAFVGGLLHSDSRDRLLSSSFGIARLAGLDACEARSVRTAAIPLPQDRVLRGRIDQIQRRLDGLVGRGELLPPADRQREAQSLAAEAQTAAYEPLTAQALFQLGLAVLSSGDQKEASRIFADSANAAARAQDDALLARTWVALINSLERQSKYEQVLALEPVAHAAIMRAGEDPYLSADLASAIGWALVDIGRYEEARARFQQAFEATNDQNHDHELARALYGRGIAERELGNYDTAARDLEESLAISQRTVGTDHPQVAMALTHLARVRTSQGQYEEARRTYEEALEIMGTVLEPFHPKIGYPHLGLAELALEQALPDVAEEHLREVEEIWRKTYPPTHHEFGLLGWFQGRLAALRGDHAKALRILEDASARLHETLGKDHPILARIHRDLAASYLERGDTERALTEAATALRTYPVHGRETNLLRQIELMHDRALRAAGPRRKASPATASPATTTGHATSPAPLAPAPPHTASPATLPPVAGPARR